MIRGVLFCWVAPVLLAAAASGVVLTVDRTASAEQTPKPTRPTIGHAISWPNAPAPFMQRLCNGPRDVNCFRDQGAASVYVRRFPDGTVCRMHVTQPRRDTCR